MKSAERRRSPDSFAIMLGGSSPSRLTMPCFAALVRVRLSHLRESRTTSRSRVRNVGNGVLGVGIRPPGTPTLRQKRMLNASAHVRRGDGHQLFKDPARAAPSGIPMTEEVRGAGEILVGDAGRLPRGEFEQA